jgi:hypothetical protein
MNTQDYEQSMKYIENFYNKCGGGVSKVGSCSNGEEDPNCIREEEDYVMC